MLNWLKRIIAARELEKLDRIETAFANAASWFSDYKDITIALFYVRDVGTGAAELSEINDAHYHVKQSRNIQEQAAVLAGRIQQRNAEAKIDEEMGALSLLTEQDLAALKQFSSTGDIDIKSFTRLVDVGALHSRHGYPSFTHFGAFIMDNTSDKINKKKDEATSA